jgi:hypothetical protein
MLSELCYWPGLARIRLLACTALLSIGTPQSPVLTAHRRPSFVPPHIPALAAVPHNPTVCRTPLHSSTCISHAMPCRPLAGRNPSFDRTCAGRMESQQWLMGRARRRWFSTVVVTAAAGVASLGGTIRRFPHRVALYVDWKLPDESGRHRIFFFCGEGNFLTASRSYSLWATCHRCIIERLMI